MSHDLSFGAQLRALRLRRELTQKDLAQMIGTSRANVAQWESGRAVPLAQIQAILNCVELPVRERRVLRKSWIVANPGTPSPNLPDSETSLPEPLLDLLRSSPSAESLEAASLAVRQLLWSGDTYGAFYGSLGIRERARTAGLNSSLADADSVYAEVCMTLGDFEASARAAREAATITADGEPERCALALLHEANSLRQLGPAQLPKVYDVFAQAEAVLTATNANPQSDARLQPVWSGIARDRVLAGAMANLQWSIEDPTTSSDLERLERSHMALKDTVGRAISGEVLARSAALRGRFGEAEDWLDAIECEGRSNEATDEVKRALTRVILLVGEGRHADAEELAAGTITSCREYGYLHYAKMLRLAVHRKRRT